MHRAKQPQTSLLNVLVVVLLVINLACMLWYWSAKVSEQPTPDQFEPPVNQLDHQDNDDGRVARAVELHQQLEKILEDNAATQAKIREAEQKNQQEIDMIQQQWLRLQHQQQLDSVKHKYTLQRQKQQLEGLQVSRTSGLAAWQPQPRTNDIAPTTKDSDKPRLYLHQQLVLDADWRSAGAVIDYSSRNPCVSINNERHCLPYFIIPGFSKCGTTWLYSMLTKHPQIRVAKRKEANVLHGPPGWANMPQYSQWMSAVEGEIVTGEGTPHTIFYPIGIRNARRLVPFAKVLILLRNPVEAAFSLYLHYRSVRGPAGNWATYDTVTFEQAWDTDYEAWQHCVENSREIDCAQSLSSNGFNLYAMYSYIYHLRPWISEYPSEQLFIITHEQLMSEPQASLTRIIDFLELQPFDWSPVLKDQEPIRLLENYLLAANRNAWPKAIADIHPQTLKLYQELGIKPFPEWSVPGGLIPSRLLVRLPAKSR